MNQRKEFLHYFFNSVRDYRYALLKFAHHSIDEIPDASDIDLLIQKKDINEFVAIIKKSEHVDWVHYYKKSFVTFISISFDDGGYLEIDLIHRFDRKGIVYLDSKDVLQKTFVTNEGLKVSSIQHTYEYVILFYLMNKTDVPENYREYFTSLSTEDRRSIFGYICHKYKLHINTLDELFSKDEREAKKVIKSVYKSEDNKFIFRLVNRFSYLRDVGRDLVHNRGITITFSGVDGAGKSTILENVKKVFQNKYRQKIVVLRHRPSLLPILSSIRHGKEKAQQRAAQNLPRQGTNSSQVNSLFRFFYYYCDYLFGQFYIYFRYTLRGYVVLYDRYYFDFIIDSRRSNIVLPKKFLRLCYYFIFKPKVNVFLYATPDVILSRKRELSAGEIQMLTTEYRELFEELGRSHKKQRYLVINNTDINHTIDLVMKQCVSFAL